MEKFLFLVLMLMLMLMFISRLFHAGSHTIILMLMLVLIAQVGTRNQCANVFKATPLVAFRRTNNLSNLLVSAKIPNPTHNTPPHGSFLCRDNCLTCNYITDGRTSYTFHSTGETEHITHHIDCNSKNVIYMVHCNRCHKQYIRETQRRLKDRFNEHRRPVDKQTVLNLLQSRNIFFLTTITLLTCYFLQLLIVIVSFRFLHCNVIYLAHAYILYFQISNCNIFVYVTLALLRYPIVTVFIVTTFATRSVFRWLVIIRFYFILSLLVVKRWK